LAALASDRVSVLVRRGSAVMAARAAMVDGQDMAAATAALGGLLSAQAPGRKHMELVVSDRYARYFVFDDLPGVRGIAELRLAMAALFEARFGESADTWRILFDYAPGAPGGVACALPRLLVEGFLAASQRAGFRSMGLFPFFVAASRLSVSQSAGDTWLAARADGHVTLGCYSRGRWSVVRTMAATADDEPSVLVRRESLRHGLDAGAPSPVVRVGQWPGDAEPAEGMAFATVQP